MEGGWVGGFPSQNRTIIRSLFGISIIWFNHLKCQYRPLLPFLTSPINDRSNERWNFQIGSKFNKHLVCIKYVSTLNLPRPQVSDCLSFTLIPTTKCPKSCERKFHSWLQKRKCKRFQHLKAFLSQFVSPIQSH